MSRRVSPAFSDYSNYGRYSDNGGYRKTYLNRLPKVHKNADIDSFQKGLTTANEAYGNYWASNQEDAQTEYTADAGYSDARSAPTLANQRTSGMSRDREKYTSRTNNYVSGARNAGATSRHTTHQPAASRSKHMAQPNASHDRNANLPPIRSDERTSSKVGQSDRGRQSRRTWAKPPQKTGEGIKVAGKLPSNFRFSDLEQMTIELHTTDGSIVSIAAVPIYINSRKK